MDARGAKLALALHPPPPYKAVSHSFSLCPPQLWGSPPPQTAAARALLPCEAASLLTALCRRPSALCLVPRRGETVARRGRRNRAQSRASRGHHRPEVMRTVAPRPSASGSSAPSTIGAVRQPRTHTAPSLTGNNVVTVPSSSPRAAAAVHKGATRRCPGAATEHHVSDAESVDTEREMSSSTSAGHIFTTSTAL
jgi:hypothetical protein